jgi:hypothetical protein
MVNNSTNINKMNNDLSPQLIEIIKKKTTTFHVRDPGPGFGQPQKCGGNVGNRWHWGVFIDSYVDYHKEKDKKFLL